MTIGDRIRRIRKKRRLTQAELAMMSGLSLSAIQGYEQGRYEPKRKSLESIAEVFKIPVDELYDMPVQLGTDLAEVGTKIEPLTDKEQRIFLAAMGRERKVCKEVDDQYTHEPYEVLLTKVCSEIERKVKKALWS